MRGHGHLRRGPAGRTRVVGELLDEAEDVVPAAAVQPGRMLAQLVEDLVHLEGGEDRLDQHRRLDRAARACRALSCACDEHVVPQPRLEMALHLRQVEIGAAAARQQLLGVVEEIQAEIEQRAGHRLRRRPDMLLRQVPAARAHQQDGGLGVERSACRSRIVEVDGAPAPRRSGSPGPRSGCPRSASWHPRNPP